MSESTDVQALAKISTEVDESQIKVVFSSQCIKAQAFLVDKLRKQTDRLKEICNFMSSANVKLESEIKFAENEIISFRLSQETIKSANVELKKELLIAKESKLDIIERIKNGEKRYEELWLECKSRFESIPYVQKLLQAQNKMKELRSYVEELKDQAEKLSKEILIKRNDFANLNIKRAIELAVYITQDRPNDIRRIEEIKIQISELTKEIQEMHIEQDSGSIYNDVSISGNDSKKINSSKSQDPDSPDLGKDIEVDLLGPLMIPIFQSNDDVDIISDKLEQVKKMDLLANTTHNIQSVPTPSTSKQNARDTLWTREKPDEYLSSFFDKPRNVEGKYKNYSRNKLINILEDVKLDKSDALDFVSKVVPEKLQPVHVIAPASGPDNNNDQIKQSEDSKKCKTIQVVELTSQDDILIPPTQFTDTKDSEEDEKNTKNKLSQHENENAKQIDVVDDAEAGDDEVAKKEVICSLTSHSIDEEANKFEEIMEVDVTDTVNKSVDASVVDQDDFSKIKDMIFKKHNLDLSPQFTYSKNISTNINKNVFTSKFFEKNEILESNNEIADKECSNKAKCSEDRTRSDTVDFENAPEANATAMDVDVETNSQAIYQKQQNPVKGFLFSHGPNDIPDSLDISVSTTGFEDVDAEFPHCIDSSLLLSPKADLPMASQDVDVQSQEVPNFLTGLRKAGLSLFGESTKSKNDANTENNGEGFTFNFSGEEKKSRGGLFSMFH
ncbi:uncharacterized protein LOC114248121 [Bombyx mandarina]|uniref:Uncharacterized protein LOC114248121 n=1 Tax=Bombyx mandarina TaxID=7092 RepID=A0A6J2K604_BOMMA|nr:uncharacterized protein LOC114248121 [Bombyx mandarina]